MYPRFHVTVSPHHQILRSKDSPGGLPRSPPPPVHRLALGLASVWVSDGERGDTWQWLSTFTLPFSSCHTYIYRVDFKFIKIVEDSFIFGVDVPVVAQSPEEAVLAVVGSRHKALGKIYHPLLQKLI